MDTIPSTRNANLPHLPIQLSRLRAEFLLPGPNFLFRSRSIQKLVDRLHTPNGAARLSPGIWRASASHSGMRWHYIYTLTTRFGNPRFIQGIPDALISISTIASQPRLIVTTLRMPHRSAAERRFPKPIKEGSILHFRTSKTQTPNIQTSDSPSYIPIPTLSYNDFCH